MLQPFPAQGAVRKHTTPKRSISILEKAPSCISKAMDQPHYFAANIPQDAPGHAAGDHMSDQEEDEESRLDNPWVVWTDLPGDAT